MPEFGRRRSTAVAGVLGLLALVGCRTADHCATTNASRSALAAAPSQPLVRPPAADARYGPAMPTASRHSARPSYASAMPSPSPMIVRRPDATPTAQPVIQRVVAYDRQPLDVQRPAYDQQPPYEYQPTFEGETTYLADQPAPYSGRSPGEPAGGAGHIPRELDMVTMPTYVIEPPDILLIEAVDNLRRPGTPLRAGDPLLIRVSRAIPVDERDDPVTAAFKQINDVYVVQIDGHVDLGPEYGRVRIAGYDLDGARRAFEDQLIRGALKDPLVSVQLAEPRGKQHVAGEHLVRPDGTVSMGVYGSVYVTGLTLARARQRIEQHLARYILDPEVAVDVLAYNSKVYYVVTDGAGAGEQVFRFPSTGNETVLDAIEKINGLPIVSCKKHIWLARPGPAYSNQQQRLDVDWDAIVRGASTETNYQVLPGDRIYVQADKLVAFDVFFAKILAPFERLAGIALLSNGTFRSIQYGHRGIGGVGGGTATGF